jgi:hypothetical protein
VLCLLINPLEAVAIGTLCAMIFRTVEISRFADKNILKRSRLNFYRVLGICSGVMFISFLICSSLPFMKSCENYFQWVIQAVSVTVVVGAVTVIAAMLFYRQVSVDMLKTVKSLLGGRRKYK